mgnify:CR=1 FL=1
MAAPNAKRERRPFGNAPAYIPAPRALRRHAANASCAKAVIQKRHGLNSKKTAAPVTGRPQTSLKEDPQSPKPGQTPARALT